MRRHLFMALACLAAACSAPHFDPEQPRIEVDLDSGSLFGELIPGEHTDLSGTAHKAMFFEYDCPAGGAPEQDARAIVDQLEGLLAEEQIEVFGVLCFLPTAGSSDRRGFKTDFQRKNGDWSVREATHETSL